MTPPPPSLYCYYLTGEVLFMLHNLAKTVALAVSVLCVLGINVAQAQQPCPGSPQNPVRACDCGGHAGGGTPDCCMIYGMGTSIWTQQRVIRDCVTQTWPTQPCTADYAEYIVETYSCYWYEALVCPVFSPGSCNPCSWPDAGVIVTLVQYCQTPGCVPINPPTSSQTGNTCEI